MLDEDNWLPECDACEYAAVICLQNGDVVLTLCDSHYGELSDGDDWKDVWIIG